MLLASNVTTQEVINSYELALLDSEIRSAPMTEKNLRFQEGLIILYPTNRRSVWFAQSPIRKGGNMDNAMESKTGKNAPAPNPNKLEATIGSRRVVVVDIGKSKRGKVRKLKKGGGPLMGKVHDVVSGLTAEEAMTGESGPVVVVVVERRPRQRFRLFG
jgi:hypothetical protein